MIILKDNDRFDVELTNKTSKKGLIIVISIIVGLFLMIFLFKTIYTVVYNENKAIYQQKLFGDVTGNENKKIYNIEDTIKNKKVAEGADYVRAKGSQIQSLYADMEGAVIIYRADRPKESSKISWIVLYVNYVVDSDGAIYDINTCYDESTETNDCLDDDTTYIISGPNKAIIEEKVFFDNYYLGKEEQI